MRTDGLILVDIQEIGVASMDVRFIDAKPLIGVYHSLYDTPYWVEVPLRNLSAALSIQRICAQHSHGEPRTCYIQNFVDPTFQFHATLGKLLGIVLMRLSGEDILPFDYTPYAALLQYARASLFADRDRHKLTRHAWQGDDRTREDDRPQGVE
jgi:hypothetical protein